MRNALQLFGCCFAVIFCQWSYSVSIDSASIQALLNGTDTPCDLIDGQLNDCSHLSNNNSDSGSDFPFDEFFPYPDTPRQWPATENMLITVVDLNYILQILKQLQEYVAHIWEQNEDPPEIQSDNMPVPGVITFGNSFSRRRPTEGTGQPDNSGTVSVSNNFYIVIRVRIIQRNGDGSGDRPESVQHTENPVQFCPACGHFSCERSRLYDVIQQRMLGRLSQRQACFALAQSARQLSNQQLARNGQCFQQQFHFPHGVIGAICAMPGNNFLIINAAPPFPGNAASGPITPDQFVIYSCGDQCVPHSRHTSGCFIGMGIKMEHPLVSEDGCLYASSRNQLLAAYPQRPDEVRHFDLSDIPATARISHLILLKGNKVLIVIFHNTWSFWIYDPDENIAPTCVASIGKNEVAGIQEVQQMTGSMLFLTALRTTNDVYFLDLQALSLRRVATPELAQGTTGQHYDNWLALRNNHLLTSIACDSCTFFLEVWQIVNEQEIHMDRVICHDQGLGVASFAELPDGRVAGLCWSNEIAIWDLEERRLISRIPIGGSLNCVQPLVILSDGQILCISGSDQDDEGECVRILDPARSTPKEE